MNLVAVKPNGALFFFNSYTGPVSAMLSGAGDGIKQSCFSRIGVSGDGYFNFF